MTSSGPVFVSLLLLLLLLFIVPIIVAADDTIHRNESDSWLDWFISWIGNFGLFSYGSADTKEKQPFSNVLNNEQVSSPYGNYYERPEGPIIYQQHFEKPASNRPYYVPIHNGHVYNEINPHFPPRPPHNNAVGGAVLGPYQHSQHGANVLPVRPPHHHSQHGANVLPVRPPHQHSQHGANVLPVRPPHHHNVLKYQQDKPLQHHFAQFQIKPPTKTKGARRPWPLLTNAGKTEEEIEQDRLETAELFEEIRDNRFTRDDW